MTANEPVARPAGPSGELPLGQGRVEGVPAVRDRAVATGAANPRRSRHHRPRGGDRGHPTHNS
jgi:hypothetical protein